MFEQNLGKVMPVGRLGLLTLDSCKDLGKKVDEQLVKWRENRCHELNDHPATIDYVKDSYLIPLKTSRFGSGEGKATLLDSVRGYDLYILVDVCNSSLSYNIAGKLSYMSPDEHYQDLKRVIAAVAGKARRINVIMPFLYEGRQHRRSGRESLDCAYALEELRDMGIDNFITFDAHDPRVQNAIPMGGFETVQPTYQFIKGLLTHVPDLQIDTDHLMVISPDEGGMGRAIYMANNLGVDMGMFYKRRDYSRIVNGRNPIVAHEYLGESVEGKDVFIADDIIASGESMLDIAYELKMRGARNIFTCCTFPLFTAGLDKFDKAYNDGIIKAVLGTNLTYRKPELLEREWYYDVDVSKYTAYFIAAINHDKSVSSIIDPMTKIRALLDKHGIPMGGQQ